MRTLDFTRRRFAAALAAALGGSALVGTKLLRGQGPLTARPSERDKPPTDDEDSLIRVNVDLVNLFFTTRKARSGELVPDLKQDDFRVFEDGKEQQIAHFSQERNLPIELGMLIDVSGSQTNLIEIERDAGSSFFSNVIRSKDEAFLLAFGRDTLLVQDFTNSVPKLQAGLSSLKGDVSPAQMRQGRSGSGGGGGQGSGGMGGIRWPGGIGGGIGGGRRSGGGYPRSGAPPRSGKGTLMFDAIYLASGDEMKPRTGRKALILITDGDDRGSYYTRDQAVEAAQRADSIIYSIYYADPRLAQRRGAEKPSGPADLQKMSDETGGRVFKVSADHPLEDVFTEIQAEMRSQYSIGYKSTNPARNGEYREVEIRAKNKDYEVQGRKGYYATRAKAS